MGFVTSSSELRNGELFHTLKMPLLVESLLQAKFANSLIDFRISTV
jgi:hypothetical protein